MLSNKHKLADALQDAQTSLRQRVPAVNSKGSSDVHQLGFVLGLVLLDD